MSTQNSIIAGVTGAVLASAGWYFLGGNVGQASAASAPDTSKEAQQSMSLSLEKPVTCPEQVAHAISFAEAQHLVADYVNPSNPVHLTYDGINTLKGWFLDRCVIENLFSTYPNADGLQLYIGLKEVAEGHLNSNDLIWMASEEIEEGTNLTRQNCISQPYSVQDITVHCPLNCPTKYDLP